MVASLIGVSPIRPVNVPVSLPSFISSLTDDSNDWPLLGGVMDHFQLPVGSADAAGAVAGAAGESAAVALT
jgi:hypothetical protein